MKICAYDAAFKPVCESNIQNTPEFVIPRIGLYPVEIDVVMPLNSLYGKKLNSVQYVVKAHGSYVVSNVTPRPISVKNEHRPRV